MTDHTFTCDTCLDALIERPALTPSEQDALDAHLAECHECRETAEAMSAIGDIFQEAAEATPMIDLEDQIMSALEPEPTPNPLPKMIGILVALIAVNAALFQGAAAAWSRLQDAAGDTSAAVNDGLTSLFSAAPTALDSASTMGWHMPAALIFGVVLTSMLLFTSKRVQPYE